MWRHLLSTPGAKTIKKNTNSTQNKSETHHAKQYEVTSFLSTGCELSAETCLKNVYSLGPWCQFKMTSSKCPYRSKHQVIIQLQSIYIALKPCTSHKTSTACFSPAHEYTSSQILHIYGVLVVICGGLLARPAAANHHKYQRNVNMQDLGRWVFQLFAKASCSTCTDKGQGLATLKEPNYLLLSQVLSVVCSGLRWFKCGSLRWFACFPLFSLPIVPNSGGDLWWFALICGGLWSLAVVCDGLSYSHTANVVL